MTNSVDFGGRPFHFIGIGGIGMSALAHIVAARRLPVSGSDIRLNHITQRLQALGAHIFDQQHPENLNFFQVAPESLLEQTSTSLGTSWIAGNLLTLQSRSASNVTTPLPELPQVICSTAIHACNAEYRAAVDLGCPIFHRSDVLAALIEDYRSIAVSGTHGKTTTSGLISYMLYRSGLDPTVVLGGEINALGGNARLGAGSYLVAEADESDGSLVKFAPEIGVITNIELDHPDHFTDLTEVVETFKTFARRCGTVVACLDCETIRRNLRPHLTYSLNPELQADYTVGDVCYGGQGSVAEVWERGTRLGELHLKLLGSHNLSNALAAIAVGRHVGLSFETLANALNEFEGARRRFEYRGSARGIVLIDDYAHHPSEIQVTLTAARIQVHTQSSRFPIQPQRIVAIFQPHRYSRTQALLDEFSRSFENADVVIVCEVYSAGEADLGVANGQKVANAIAQHHPEVYYCGALDQVIVWLSQHLHSGDLALFLGAGNLNQIIPAVLEQLQTSNQPALS